MTSTRTSYDLLEDKIVEKLHPLVESGIEVLSSPDTDAEYNENGKPFEFTRVTVMYAMSEFDDQPIKGEPKNYAMGIVKQNEFAEITLNFQARKRRGVKGLFAVYQDCKNLILGFRPEGWGKIFFKDFLYVERSKDNVWFYALTVVCRREVFQCSDDNLNLIHSCNTSLQEVFPDEPLLKNVDLNILNMPTYSLTSLKELQADGLIKTDLADDALVYLSVGNQPFVITGLTLKTLLSSSANRDFDFTLNATGEKTITNGSLIEKIVIIPNASGTVRIGTTNGGQEILEDFEVVVGEAQPIALDFYISANSILYMAGPSCTIKYYVR